MANNDFKGTKFIKFTKAPPGGRFLYYSNNGILLGDERLLDESPVLQDVSLLKPENNLKKKFTTELYCTIGTVLHHTVLHSTVYQK